jgi:tRNA pseudouridine55 synthase
MPIAIPLDQLPVYSTAHLPAVTDNFTNGSIFLIDKPKGWSSFKVVKRLRRFLDLKKIGHAGTLDPLATGLLVVCTGKATKSIQYIQELTKEYVADIRFGASTPSFDAETEFDNQAPYEHITKEGIEDSLREYFNGTINQMPPMYSALKHKGQRLYKLARKGETVERKTRQITIYNTDILNFYNPNLTLKVECSKGTYIRTLADDLGRKMNSLAYLYGLKRTRTGSYNLENALSIELLQKIFSNDRNRLSQ